MNIFLLEKDSNIKLSRNNEKHYLVKEEVSLDEINRFLESLPENYELEFHDQFYPSISDPGAFVFIQRKANIFIYMLGNHGWSSKWSKQSIEFITAYVLINAKSHRIDGLPFILTIGKSFRNCENVERTS